MSNRSPNAKDTHYANLRRKARERLKQSGDYEAPAEGPADGRVWLYGLHAVEAAIKNPRRTIHGLWVTKNAAARLETPPPAELDFPVFDVEPRFIDKKLEGDAVHQGVLLEADALTPKTLEDIWHHDWFIVLDQVTDPHNVGAIMRSAVAAGAGALVTTARHSPTESGVLAKVASGGLEHIDLVHVRNLANAITAINERGYQTIGLDSQGPRELEATVKRRQFAVVLGAEGKGLRQKTRDTVSDLARINMPGPIKSLNVSNAAALAMYVAMRAAGRLT
ncbi:MAG: RNA methyltransferase, partial [Pseudomonadota bacterium]